MKAFKDKTIMLDVDGVLAGFFPAVCKKFGISLMGQTTWSLDWIKDNWKTIVLDTDMWANLPLMIDPELIPFKISGYITSLPPELEEIRMYWLKMQGFPEAQVYFTWNESKLPVIKDLEVDIFVDDKPSTVKELNDAGHFCVQILPYYMDSSVLVPGVPAISHLAKLEEVHDNWLL